VIKAFNTFGAEFHADAKLATGAADLYLAGDDAAGVGLPVRREQAAERRDEVAAAVVVDRPREILDLRRGLDQLQVVAQPLDERAGHGDRALERVHRVGVAELPCDGGDQAVLGDDRLGAGVQQHEIAGAVGVLAGAGLEADLAEGGRVLVAEHPGRFARVVAANTGLPTGDVPMPDVWHRFREVVRTAPALSVSRLVQSGCRTTLTPEVLAAYEAPFPDPSYAAAVRAMPELIPTTPDDPASEANRAAWRQLAAWDKPFLVAFSDRDPITGAMAPVLKDTVPGAAGLEHPVIEGAGHFLQEDAGERLGAVIAEFVRAHPA